MTTLTEVLNNPEEHYPGNFDTPKRANALLTGLCQDASAEINRLVSFNNDLKDEVVEQCRINGMSAEREDALRAEVERLKKAPDYAWPTIEDYEKEVGFEVNDAFRAAWTMARTTNDLFKQMGEST